MVLSLFQCHGMSKQSTGSLVILWVFKVPISIGVSSRLARSGIRNKLNWGFRFSRDACVHILAYTKRDCLVVESSRDCGEGRRFECLIWYRYGMVGHHEYVTFESKVSGGGISSIHGFPRPP